MGFCSSPLSSEELPAAQEEARDHHDQEEGPAHQGEDLDELSALVEKRGLTAERAKQIIEMNKVMARHTEEIENVNAQMKEGNRIKEEYIGRFLELSSLLLSNTEQRMKKLNRLARDRKNCMQN